MRLNCRPLALLGVTVLVAGTPATSHGQWQAGVKAGYGQSAFTGSTEFQWQSATTYAAFASGAISRMLALQAEVSLSQKIGESRVTGSSLTFDATYLSVPILLRF